jgi:hypothetical protein
MRLRSLLLSLLSLLTLIVAASLHAADLAGSNVIVPLAGRTTGAYGSQWQTDLVITNAEPRAVPLVITFYGPDGERSFATMSLAARGTLVLDDVLFRTLGQPSGLGMLRVSSAFAGARFTARAYVANRGGAAGEFGQNVPAVPVDALQGEHVLSGLTTGGGSRTNIGVANPWTVPATVTLALHDAEGEELARIVRLVPALEVLQLSDLPEAFGVASLDKGSVRVTSQVGVYAYASIVRNDNGAAVFVPGSGIGVSAPPAAPRCAEPASLGLLAAGRQAPASWVVVLKQDTTPGYIRNVLPARHGFELMDVYDVLPGFAAELTPQQIAALRCDGAVEFIAPAQ